MSYVTCEPAYGRDYKSKKAVLEDWNAGKDFRINCFAHPKDGSYVNKHDAAPGETYNIRYDQQRKVLPVKAA